MPVGEARGAVDLFMYGGALGVLTLLLGLLVWGKVRFEREVKAAEDRARIAEEAFHAEHETNGKVRRDRNYWRRVAVRALTNTDTLAQTTSEALTTLLADDPDEESEAT